MASSRQGHLQIVKLLLDKGAGLNASGRQGRSPLILAARSGHTKVVELLLDHGTDVRSRSPDGATALIQASGNGHAATATILLDRGADVNARAEDGMLKNMSSGENASVVDKAIWVEMLRAAGMDDDAMTRWHTELEQRAPHAHHEFLLSLGIPEDEALRIRQWARRNTVVTLSDQR